MEQISKTRELRARMAELFDLPADLVAGLAHLELLGDRQLLEGHGGILAYSDTRIDVSVGGMTLRIEGAALALRSMTDRELRVRGRIDGVSFVR